MPIASLRRLKARSILLLPLLLTESTWEVQNSSNETEFTDFTALQTDDLTFRSRRLQVAVTPDWQWPSGSYLTFTSTKGSQTTTASGIDVVQVCAAVLYNQLYIGTGNTAPGSAHSSPIVKLVSNSAGRSDCKTTGINVPVGTVQPASSSTPATYAAMGSSNGPLKLAINGLSIGASGVNIVFMQGGMYKLCYKPSGQFGDANDLQSNVVATNIQVFGISSDCSTDGCLDNARWDCFFGYKGESVRNCQFNFQFDGGRPGWSIQAGLESRITWTPMYQNDDIDSSGQSTASYPRPCATAFPEKSVFILSDSVYNDIDSTTSVSMPPVNSKVTDAFTVAACYCPNYNSDTGKQCSAGDGATCCDSFTEFIQQIGVVYFWTIRICDYDTYKSCTVNAPTSYRYMRVIPHQKFVLRIDCPPGGGCRADRTNRIKYVANSVDNNRPSWAGQACKTAPIENGAAFWPFSNMSMNLDGGSRVDYKFWRTNQVKIALSIGRALDVCFAVTNTKLPGDWFKVGQVQITKAIAFASKPNATANADFISYAGYPGSVTFYGGLMTTGIDLNPYEGNRFSGKALINIISYDREKNYGIGSNMQSLEASRSYDTEMSVTYQQEMDGECQKETYSPKLTTGLTSKQAIRDYTAVVDPSSDNTLSSYLTFNGGTAYRRLTLPSAGVVAICYCGVLDAQGGCLSPSSSWVFAGRTTIAGPTGDQSWIFPTQIVVSMQFTGWGFSTADKIRLVPPTQDCSNNQNNPPSSVVFKVGCPAVNGLGCRQATNAEIISTKIVTAISSSLFILSATVAQFRTSLQFSGPVTGILNPDDMITIDLDRVTVNGIATTNASISPRALYEASRFTGVYQYQDDPSKTYIVAHRLTPEADTTKMTIPVGWVSNSEFGFKTGPFNFTDMQGWWVRRNQEQTNLEIKGTQAASGIKVCWGVTKGSSTMFYKQAGTVTFQEPQPMADAVVSLTTVLTQAEAPIVISFSTDPKRVDYATATGKTMLLIRFLDLGNKIEPLYFSQAGAERGVYPIPDQQEILPENAGQYVCGKVFTELWSSDSEGFPMPTGCYFTKKLADAPDSNGPGLFYREIYIVFGEQNGLRHNTDYQMVLNARLKTIRAGDNIVDIYAMCGHTGCSRPYQVFEKGSAVASKSTMTREVLDPQLAPVNGFLLQNTDEANKVLTLSSSSNSFQVQLTGTQSADPIVQQSILRIFLWPLTSWDLGATCSATCIPAVNYTCLGNLGCSPTEVVSGSLKRNVMKLTLPQLMDPITDAVIHTIKVNNLKLPANGFFPTSLGVQLTQPDDTSPFYILSTGFLMKAPDPNRTSGRLVITDRSGYGPFPFQAQTQNQLVLRLQLGVTVWNVGRAHAAYLQIQLPPGYGTCQIIDTGAPSRDLEIFGHKTNGYIKNNRGVLAVSNDDGDWTNSASGTGLCTYSLSANHQAIYAGMVFYVQIQVDNPTTALPKTSADNVWRIKLSSLGQCDPPEVENDPVLFDMPLVDFISLNQEIELGQDLWAGNAAVMQTLSQALVQPSTFVSSCCGVLFSTRRTLDTLRIFFKTGLYVGQDGYIVLDAPVTFDFGANCTAGDLDERYYVYVGQGESQMNPVRSKGSCTGIRYPWTSSTYNRAQLQVGGITDNGFYYGYTLAVTHPTTYDESQQSNWYLWLLDKHGYVMQGSPSSVSFNAYAPNDPPFFDRSFGMYADNLPNLEVKVANMRPLSVTGKYTQVTIYPFYFPLTTDSSLRITSPHGFNWNPDVKATFVVRTNGSNQDFSVPAIRNWTYGFSYNQLVWPGITFQGGYTYGFQASIAVPDYNPVISSNSFFIEIGYASTDFSIRSNAAVIEAQTIASIVDAQIDFASQYVGYQDNRIEFRFKTVTPLHLGDGIVIRGGLGTQGYTFTCPIAALPDSAPIPNDLRCIAVIKQGGYPQLTIKVTNKMLPPGFYGFEIKAENPTSVTSGNAYWIFGTYFIVDNFPNAVAADKDLTVLGFSIYDMIGDSKLLSLSKAIRIATNRIDRPGTPNSLIFSFQLRNTPYQDGIMVLKAPRGFSFSENCLPGLIVNKNEVFGPKTGAAWPPDYAVWPDSCKPTRCSGVGRSAHIYISMGLQKRNIYVFRIAVEKNPIQTPVWNKWSITYNSETSDPFLGFPVWTNLQMSISPSSQARGVGGSPLLVPVTITFTTFNQVPSRRDQDKGGLGGLIRLSAPPGFTFVAGANNVCTVNFFSTDQNIIFGAADMACQVKDGNLHLMINGYKSVIPSLSYTLIVKVYHPNTASSAASWTMESFGSSTPDPSTALDVTSVVGYDVIDVCSTFVVSNPDRIFDGFTKVNNVNILLELPATVQDGDVVQIRGPMGFYLIGNPELEDCNAFAWKGPDAFPLTVGPKCQCDATNLCNITWKVQEKQAPAPALAANSEIRFALATQNPFTTPFITSNYWKAYHSRDSVVLSSQIQEGWQVKPQLAAVNVRLVGTNLAAGRYSDLQFLFTPVNSADTIMIEAVAPLGFSFDRSTVAVPYVVSQKSAGRTIIINNGGFVAGRAVRLRINTVLLGKKGGQTVWNLQTYTDQTMSVKRDENVGFNQGFILPGLITVIGTPVLSSKYQNFPDLYPVQSLFAPRVQEDAQAKFIISFTMPVQSGETLSISCQGSNPYTLKTAPFIVIGTGQIATTTSLASSGALLAQLRPGVPASQVALEANTPYTVIFWVFPYVGVNTWRFDTSVSSFPSNTNDGGQPGFNPVPKLLVAIGALRSPPATIIDVTLTVQLGTITIQELFVVAPPGFFFDKREGSCGDMCKPSPALGSTGRWTATIASPTGQPLSQSVYRLRVLTPQITPSSVAWYIEGQAPDSSTMVGWSESPGFMVTQMAGTTISYPAIGGLKNVQILFTFTLDIDAGTQIQVVAPPGFTLTCSADGTLKQLNLPGSRPDCVDDPLQLKLAATLTVGSYSFGLEASLPSTTPTDNTFSLVILGQDNAVVNAAYNVQGQAMTGITARSPELTWSSSKPGSDTKILISLTFIAPTRGIKAILISLPPSFTHNVQTLADVTNVNRLLPLGSGSNWVDSSEKDRLKVLLDGNSGTTIPAGTYAWSFPASLPSSMPPLNFWAISLCSDTTCIFPTDRSVLVSFPIAGFQMYEVAPEALLVTTNLGRRSQQSSYVCMMLCAFVSFSFTLRRSS